MATPEPATGMTPLEYMALADKALSEGNNQEAAGFMWKATESTYIGLAKERGLDYSDLFAVAQTLEEEKTAPKRHFTVSLIISESLRDHAVTDEMLGYELEDYQLEGAYQVTRSFVMEQNSEYR